MIKPERDFIGGRSLARPGLNDPERWQLVGLVPEDGKTAIPPGSKIVGDQTDRYIGEVTSTTWSPTLGIPIGLGLLAGGRLRHGQCVTAAAPLMGQSVPVVVRGPVFFDPEGKRLHV
jgi:glycine cleavage system aminomethyltransferase T